MSQTLTLGEGRRDVDAARREALAGQSTLMIGKSFCTACQLLSTSHSPESQDPPLCHPMLASHLVLHSCRGPICTEHSGTPVPGVQELFLGVHCERAPWGLWDKAGSTERPSDP